MGLVWVGWVGLNAVKKLLDFADVVRPSRWGYTPSSAACSAVALAFGISSVDVADAIHAKFPEDS